MKNCQLGATANKKYVIEIEKVIITVSRLLPCLSARYPPGIWTNARVAKETKPINPTINGFPPNPSIYLG